jgi:uncharacterized repeat protein (TIGR03803 family)
VRPKRLCRAASVAATCVIAILAAQSSQAQTYKVLYSFQGIPDGTGPTGGVIQDATGNLYGTTTGGGVAGGGTIFKLSKTGKETVLYSFCTANNCSDGLSPYAGVIQDTKGNLYGTTTAGANCIGRSDPGCGIVFKVNNAGQETVLYTFLGVPDAGYPRFADGVIRDASGNLYGSTYGGGTFGYGAVFKLSPTGKETVLYSFTGGADGASPEGGVIRDAKGNLYGTTSGGGEKHCQFGCGVVFRLNEAGKETVLYSFKGGSDGGSPVNVGLIQDAKGNLYGTTNLGGDLSSSLCHPVGCGVVFKLGATGKETMLYSFKGGADGNAPLAGVIRDAKGNFYGTTNGGGDLSCNVGGVGCGVVLS